jgi:hypothetical protein
VDIRSGAGDAIPLGRIIDEIGEFDDGLTVYAPAGVEVSPETPVYLVDEEAEEPPAGAEYVLELSLMKNVVKVWSAWRNGAVPTVPQACEAVLHYAKYDAYLPVSQPEA